MVMPNPPPRPPAKRSDVWIYIGIAVIATVIIIALFGYFTGAWEAPID